MTNITAGWMGWGIDDILRGRDVKAKKKVRQPPLSIAQTQALKLDLQLKVGQAV
jgi:hypothetical protein